LNGMPRWIRRSQPRKHQQDTNRSSQEIILAGLRKHGCLFCREESDAVRRHFFWYLAEQYFEPHSIDRMRRSQGFCRRHTRQLQGHGSPSTIGRIYLWMLAPYLDVLRAAEKAQTAVRASDVLPKANCDMCETEARARDGQLHHLQAALTLPEVWAALERNPPCMLHFRAISSSLEWEQLSCLTDAVLSRLSRGAADPRPWVSFVFGYEPEAGLRRFNPARESPNRGAASKEAWSPSLQRLRERILTQACPMCHARHTALESYLDWLAHEVQRDRRTWDDALWLCREHLGDFASGWGDQAARRLAEATALYWQSQLRDMSAVLACRPSSNLARRLLTEAHEWLGRDSRQQWWSALWGRRLWSALASALRSPQQRLADLCRVGLRSRPCPACRSVNTIANRTAELLVRGLTDTETRRLYDQSAGICFRDLVLTLRICPDSDGLRLLVQQARVRLEVLQWELEEMQRKEAWDVRHEPKAGEQGAWRRAVEQWSGSYLDAPAARL
jgi:hypothetical protein